MDNNLSNTYFLLETTIEIYRYSISFSFTILMYCPFYHMSLKLKRFFQDLVDNNALLITICISVGKIILY